MANTLGLFGTPFSASDAVFLGMGLAVFGAAGVGGWWLAGKFTSAIGLKLLGAAIPMTLLVVPFHQASGDLKLQPPAPNAYLDAAGNVHSPQAGV